ncbi:MAG: type-4 uracil-DNA glycosylase [Candidatus Bathyarchaeota archaeon]|nr:type-4 uracil-DNA glycosylase [Candidatus Bathyarchaeota archaeon]
MFKLGVLEEVASEIKTCKKCELWKTRRNTVPGEGSSDAKIMFIGEAPGYWEDIQGKPFVGAAGKLLDRLLTEACLSRDRIFIGNVLKCRPPGNRDPLPSELIACTPYLDKQIQAIKPKIIVTLGNYSTAYLFSKAELKFNGISSLRGKFYKIKLLNLEVTVFPTLHPAAGLYSTRYRQVIIEDFKRLKEWLTVEGLI